MSAAALVTAAELACLEAAGLGELGARLLGRIEQDRREIDWRNTRIEKLIDADHRSQSRNQAAHPAAAAWGQTMLTVVPERCSSMRISPWIGGAVSASGMKVGAGGSDCGMGGAAAFGAD